ncbi:MAG: AAA family ATPase [Thermoanaerobaculia bacterium]|nr:AAA family ATPase [Thermoanaerobaculia bacterium]
MTTAKAAGSAPRGEGGKPGITSLKIEGFRALRKLTIEGLGRVNLITGRNNTGKSSVLEALRLLATEASALVIYSILQHREGAFEDKRIISSWMSISSEMWLLASLFSGFPAMKSMHEPVSIRGNGGKRSLEVVISKKWFSRRDGSAGDEGVEIAEEKPLAADNQGLLIEVKTAGRTQLIPLANILAESGGGNGYSDVPPLPCIYIGSHGVDSAKELGALWDRVVLSDQEQDVVDALRIIDPQISAVSMVGGDEPLRPRVAIVRTSGFKRPVPLRSCGDGLNRLFGIVLSLVNARGGFLLIDEFENGMHHTVQLDTWRAIFRLARNLDVQIFATSHSWDAIEAFQKAAAESPEDGVLVRLSRRDDKIISTVFREDELAVATRDGIEVR